MPSISGFTTGSGPVAWGAIDSLFANLTIPAMAYLLALGSAALYGAADFLGGLASRQTNTITIVVTSQGAGLALVLLILPLLPLATPTVRDLIWGGTAGLAGGTGVALLYRALAGIVNLLWAARSCPVKSTFPIVLSRRTSPHPIQRTHGYGAGGGEPTAGGVD